MVPLTFRLVLTLVANTAAAVITAEHHVTVPTLITAAPGMAARDTTMAVDLTHITVTTRVGRLGIGATEHRGDIPPTLTTRAIHTVGTPTTRQHTAMMDQSLPLCSAALGN
jgi:hypothetical protein